MSYPTVGSAKDGLLSISGVLVARVLVIAAIALLVIVQVTNPADKNVSTPHVTTFYGKEIPPQISEHIPENMRPFVTDVEIYALDCSKLAALRAKPLFDRLVALRDDARIWHVQLSTLRGQSDFRDSNYAFVDAGIESKTREELPGLVRQVSATITAIERPPSKSEACLNAIVRAVIPFIPDPYYRITVPSDASVGGTYSTSTIVHPGFVGLDPSTNRLTFRIELKFGRSGGYRYSLQAKTADALRQDGAPYELTSSEHRWFEVQSLDGWKLFVDIQNAPP